MAAILTDKFRVVFAEKFKDAIALKEIPGISNVSALPASALAEVWLFFAKATKWKDFNTGDPVNVPANPIDNQSQAYKIYDQILGLKRVTSAEMRSVIRNNKWATGTVYDIYRHDYGDITNVVGNVTTYVQSNNFEQHLYETNFYVVTSEYKVYKCLDNNNNGESTTEPSSTSSAPFTLPDGYVWKYMFTVNANDFEKFKTDEYVPIPEDSAIDSSNVISPAANFGGSIYNVLIDNAGTGYLANTEFDIIGDGTNGKVRITSTNQSGGITGVKVVNPGQGYTFGQINLSTGTNGILRPVMTGKEGLGQKIGRELGAYRIAMHAKLEKDDFLFGNDFHVVGLLYNPVVSTSSGIAIGTKQLKLSAPLSNSTAGHYDDVKITGSTSGAGGRIVHYETDGTLSGGVYTIYYTQENQLEYGLSSTGTKPNFVAGETVLVAAATSETVVIDSDASTAVKDSELTRGSGEIIYIDNRATISRAEDQTEDFKIIVEF